MMGPAIAAGHFRVWSIVVAALLAVVAGSACENRGGEGEPCNSASILGPFTCDTGLVCNEALGSPTCQKPMSRREAEPCSSNNLCGPGLRCDNVESKCRPFLKQGDPCFNPSSCGPGLACTKDLATMTTTCQPSSS